MLIENLTWLNCIFFLFLFFRNDKNTLYDIINTLTNEQKKEGNFTLKK